MTVARLLRDCSALLHARSALPALYAARLIRYEVPVHNGDRVAVPPLSGFVMNRVGNDHMERLLYEIFVSSDESTTVAQCAAVTVTRQACNRRVTVV